MRVRERDWVEPLDIFWKSVYALRTSFDIEWFPFACFSLDIHAIVSGSFEVAMRKKYTALM